MVPPIFQTATFWSEDAEAFAHVAASGMAALTTAVLAFVSAGGHVIGQQSTYGGTASVLLNLLPRLGVSTTLMDQADWPDRPSSWTRSGTRRCSLAPHSARAFLGGCTIRAARQAWTAWNRSLCIRRRCGSGCSARNSSPIPGFRSA